MLKIAPNKNIHPIPMNFESYITPGADLSIAKNVNSKYEWCSMNTLKLIAPSQNKLIGTYELDLDIPNIEFMGKIFVDEDKSVMRTKEEHIALTSLEYRDRRRNMLLSKKLIQDPTSKKTYLFAEGFELPDQVMSHLLRLFQITNNGIIGQIPNQQPLQTYLCTHNINPKALNISLTKKETETLYHLVRGKSAKMIGNEMNISRRTAEAHLFNLKNKFNCNTKNQLIEAAIELGYAHVIPACAIQPL